MRSMRARWARTGGVLALLMVAGSLVPALAGHAVTANQQLDLQALVIVTGNPGCDYTVNALMAALDAEGVPYTEVNLSDPGRPVITDAFLSAALPSGVTEGKFNAVFATNSNPFTSFCLTAADPSASAETTSLTNYETTFGVRQVDAYTYPVGATVGFEGTLDGMPAVVTAAGLAGPFSYLNGPVPIDNYDPNVSEAYGILAVPAPGPGQSFTPLVDAPIPNGNGRGSLIGVFDDGARQQLVMTMVANANQTYFRVLSHGIISWATNDVHLGYSRNYFSVHVDDLFSDDSQWSTIGKCTPGEDCPIGSTITTPNIRMTAADVTTAVSWEQQNNFKFTFAFNGEASDSLTGATPGQAANTPGLVDDPLTDALLANKSAFNWLNHTYSHLHLGCVQNTTVRPWVCETTDGLPVNCPSASTCNILWQTAATSEPEITNNILFAHANGITIDPTELLSGEYSGLYYLPQEPIDNPNFITALNATGIRVTGADASRQPNTRPVGNAITSPRYPMSIWYNVDTIESEIDEYNWLYAAPPAGGGFCQSNPAIVTCLAAPLTYTSQTDNGFLSYIVPTETRLDMQHIITNDPRPHYIHQPNFTGDQIVYPVMNSILGEYASLFGASAPIVEPTETDAANIEVAQQAWHNTAPGAVTAYLLNGNVTIQGVDANTHNVPVTVPAGTTVNGAPFGTSYAGDLSGWLTVLPTPSVMSVTPGTIAQGATNATFTMTGTGFVNGATVTVSGTNVTAGPAVVSNNGTTLTATLSATASAALGARDVTVTDPDGFSGTLAGGLTVNAAPVITSATSTTFTVGQPANFTVATTGVPAPTLSEQGALPSGVTFSDNGNGTATLGGALTSASVGTFPLTISANSVAGTATQAFTLTVITGNLVITNAPSTTFTTGQASTFAVTATGAPTPTLSEQGALPAGVSFTAGAAGTATLQGTPGASSGGVYPITFTATSTAGRTSQAFTLTVNQAPAFTTGSNLSETVGAAFTANVAATGYPAPALAASGLPAGVTLTANGNGTGTIAGTPATAGTYPVTLTATSTAGTATRGVTLTVRAAGTGTAILPTFTSPASTTATVGTAFDFKVMTAAAGQVGVTTRLSRTGTLPGGVSFVNNNNGTADLIGTPSGSGGSFLLTLTASNSTGTTTQAFVLTVGRAPAVTSTASAVATVGASFSFTVRTSGSPPPALTQGGTLPAGITFLDNGNGTATIAGTPNAGAGGLYPLTITATNPSGTGNQAFSLTVRQPPTITNASSTAAVHGTAFSLTFTATGYPAPSLTRTGTVPGLSWTNPGNGTRILSGTPTTAGRYTLTLTATNNTGTTTQTFTLTVT